MRVLIVSALYPPVAFGGYEVECSAVAERLAAQHEVRVLTGDQDRDACEDGEAVWRELTRLPQDWRGSLAAPRAALRAAASTRRALAWGPDLAYVWNGAAIPQTALRLLADAGVPVAFRVCEHWFAGMFSSDQFMRELLPARRAPARAAWSLGMRALNAGAPGLRLRPRAPIRCAISWNSEAIRRMAPPPPFVRPALERVCHSVPRHGELFAAVERSPAPRPRIAFLGRVTPYKGLAVAIEALALLRDEHALVAELVVLGPEDQGHGEELRALAGRLGVAGSISWQGPTSPEQAARTLASAHALIVPSVWQEPFPLVTIEGALARVPLVASDVGGIAEGMHDGEHALLFAPGDARGAAAALARTLGEPEQTAARVRRALERARRFSLFPYLEEQAAFVTEAHAVLSRTSAS